MENKKISLITTLKNEAESIRTFLDSILNQTKIPDEIIIVDGGSTDGTVKVLKEYALYFEEKNIRYKIIIKKGANIAQGRNLAIKNSSGDIIACTDAGCILDKRWLEEITKPLERNPIVDVVSGWYEPLITSKFESIVAELTYPKLKKVSKNIDKFLPSSRSIAFKRKCWEKVGGYPEWLYTAEDTLFDLRLKEAGCKFIFNPNAIVYWKVRENVKKLFKQYYQYAKGDGFAGIFHLKYLISSYIPTIAGILLLLKSMIFHTLWPILVLVSSTICYTLLRGYYLGANLRTILKNLHLSVLIMTVVVISNAMGYTIGIMKRLTRKLLK
ncbi:glycosyltransferase family 2 protein [Geoglobus acetivorans]|uniref:Putative glycosyl transferase n=1 Tax=Geoglobus acetivorans TaxID=565033 RepID=A0A0A7GDT6_GEOAI|nr:putative glycosyl transferase [Geoglobus acetivorans]